MVQALSRRQHKWASARGVLISLTFVLRHETDRAYFPDGIR